MRDDFSLDTKRLLAARVGWRCSNPRCSVLTAGPAEDAGRALNIGVAAHITAASPGGPRYASELSEQHRKSAENGIWLCQNCAHLIDADPNQYWVGQLRFWKADSEELARNEMGTGLGRSIDLRPLRFSAIGVAKECLWRRSRGLERVLQTAPVLQDFCFHEIPESCWAATGKSPDTHVVDPIVDVTVVNDGSASGTVTAVGVELLRTWTVLKGLPVAQKVLPTDVYILELQKMVPGEPQVTILSDPVAIPQHGLFRYQLWLGNFHGAAQNQSLIRLLVEFEGKYRRSGAVYLGTY